MKIALLPAAWRAPRDHPLPMKDFGLAVTYKGDWPDTYGLMRDIQRQLIEAQREAMNLEYALTFLRLKHPGRARRWAKAQRAYEDWLATLEPKRWPVCEECGRPWDDDD